MLTLKAKRFFFDRKVVADRIGDGNLRAYSKAGAFVRRRAQSIMRRRKAPARPGQPPSVHQGDLKRLLFFALDPISDNVVVGPVAFNQKSVIGGQIAGGKVPSILEFGGNVGIREVRVGQRWMTVGKRRPRPGQPTRVRKANYPGNPFMGPALEEAQSKLSGMWEGSVRSG